jgi:hypothetical protein
MVYNVNGKIESLVQLVLVWIRFKFQNFEFSLNTY